MLRDAARSGPATDPQSEVADAGDRIRPGRRTPRTAIAIALAAGLPMIGHAQSRSPAGEAINAEATLPKLEVSADEPGAEADYRTSETRTATRTDTPLRDVPQSITVIPQQLISDQSMQSMADVVRYVPGVGMAQGE